jgi:hypothetical protein
MSGTFQLSEGKGLANIYRHPDECPICHSKIAPLLKFSKMGGRIYTGNLEVLYLCPNNACDELFIGYYEQSQIGNQLISTRPVEPAPRAFSDPIKGISQTFCDIYEEAHRAEQFGLTQICGVGYRKSLEFLIKDYLIKDRPGDKAGIEAAMLGTCIENYVIDPRIKEVAKRATWLGNDETHYQRRWVGKDLIDLKILTDLVIHWIEAEHLTKEALKSMPAPGKP